MTTIRKTTWNTYRTTCYTHDVANDRRSAGGTHNHQVRKTAAGWQRRIRQSNGAHESFGPAEPISDEDGEAAFELAKKC